jgi:glycogen synthase
VRERCLKRILMTGDTVGGVWTFTLELAEALAHQGIDVVLASMGGEADSAQRADAARIPGLTLRTTGFKLEWMEDPWEDVAESGRWLLGLEREYQPDLVHLNTYGHGSLAWGSPVVLTAHSCVLSWWRAVKREPLPEKWDRYREVVTASMKAADAVTAPSRTMLQAIEEHYGPAISPVRRAIPNGRSARLLHAAAKEPLVLTAGRLWDEAKNAAAVARVAARLPWPVYLAGDDRAPDGERALFKACTMLGRLAATELAAWYARAPIYALPARYEPFGLSALEAALSGCALVLGDIASLREVWDDAAVYVDPDDPGHLEAALCNLIRNTRYREEMARRAEARARTFTPERMTREYLDVYRAAVAERRTACVS